MDEQELEELEAEQRGEQVSMFDIPDIIETEWQDMPEFLMKDLTPFRTVYIHFRNQADIDEFARLIGQRIHTKQKSAWHPQLEIRPYADKRFVDENAAEVSEEGGEDES